MISFQSETGLLVFQHRVRCFRLGVFALDLAMCLEEKHASSNENLVASSWDFKSSYAA